MTLVVTDFFAGVVGTLAMDLLNNLLARTGTILKIESPDRIKAFVTPLANHLFYGVGLAVGVVLG